MGSLFPFFLNVNKIESYENLCASENTTFNDIKTISFLTLSNHRLTSLLFDTLHSIKDNTKFIRIKARKHECLFKSLFQGFSNLRCLRIFRSLEFLLLIPFAEDFSAYRLSWSPLDLLFRQCEKLSYFFFLFRILIWILLGWSLIILVLLRL